MKCCWHKSMMTPILICILYDFALQIMMVGFRFVSFHNQIKKARKFSTLPLIIFVHPSIKQKHNDGNDNFDNILKVSKFICKIRKQVQLCVFPCNVALHQVQISDFGTLSLILVSFYFLSNLSPVFARTSQWKPNTSVGFTENSFFENIVKKGRQVNSIDKGKELWKVESCLLSNTKDKIYN